MRIKFEIFGAVFVSLGFIGELIQGGFGVARGSITFG